MVISQLVNIQKAMENIHWIIFNSWVNQLYLWSWYTEKLTAWSAKNVKCANFSPRSISAHPSGCKINPKSISALLRILPQQPLHALDIPSLHSLTEVLTWTWQVTESPFWAQSVVNCRCEGSWFACLNAWLPMAARSSWRFLLRWELGSKFERLKCGLLAVCNLLWRAKQNESSVCQ